MSPASDTYFFPTHSMNSTLTASEVMEARIQKYVDEGCSRGDAQGIVEAEDMRHDSNGKLLKVYSMYLSNAFGGYYIRHFKTRQEAEDNLESFKQAYATRGSISIKEKDGVYNGGFKLQTAEQFHAE